MISESDDSGADAILFNLVVVGHNMLVQGELRLENAHHQVAQSNVPYEA